MYYVKKIYIFKDTHLPKRGWLQGCFCCQQITSRLYLYQTFTRKKTIYEFYVYKCSNCKKKLQKRENINDYIEFNEECSHWIETKYSHLFTS